MTTLPSMLVTIAVGGGGVEWVQSEGAGWNGKGQDELNMRGRSGGYEGMRWRMNISFFVFVCLGNYSEPDLDTECGPS